MGAVRLRAELEAKGIDPPVVERTVGELYAGQDEPILAMRVLADLQRTRRLAPAKLVGTLRQRGFDDETIEYVMGRAGLHPDD